MVQVYDDNGVYIGAVSSLPCAVKTDASGFLNSELGVVIEKQAFLIITVLCFSLHVLWCFIGINRNSHVGQKAQLSRDISTVCPEPLSSYEYKNTQPLLGNINFML